MARRPDSTSVTRHPAQLLALAIGVIYTLVGIAGFFVTGFDNFAAETDKTLLGFEINPLHNLVGLAFLYGLFAAGNSDINFLSINGADNGLHLVSALAGLAIALWPARRTARSGLADRGA
jgi:Domain of unknown function (DUF4383)